jgi:2',3'-cyclic-nucleotide 2'-phosphodiesterase (5'-nucleotidase family)
MNRVFIISVLLMFAGISCKSSEKVAEPLEYRSFYSIGDSLEKDPAVESWLESWREIYNREMERPVARAHGSLTFGRPESSLGNLAADMIRYRAAHEFRKYVHIALIDSDGLKVEFDEGDISLGDLYEFMPYDNTLVILELQGSYIKDLADEIAAIGGAPVSGMRMTINDETATGILVDSESLDPDKLYLVATSSYVANGDGGFDSIQNSAVRHDYSLLIRDIFIDHMRRSRELTPVEDLRIRIR